MKLIRHITATIEENRQRATRRKTIFSEVGQTTFNLMLRPLERLAVRRYRSDQLPIILFVGAPRSGTTLLYQLMCNHLDIAYIPNFVARHWLAPVVGAMRYERKRRTGADHVELSSDLGGTQGDASPHEFSYFWRFWLGLYQNDVIESDEVSDSDWRNLRAELEGVAGYQQRPLVMKSVDSANYNIPTLAERLPQSRFLWIRRTPEYTAQSILAARRKRYGDESVWWSVRTPDHRTWKESDPLEQVAHQVTDIEEQIAESFEALPHERRLETSYESVVDDPLSAIEEIASFIPARITNEDILRDLNLSSSNRISMELDRFSRLQQLLGRKAD